MTAAVWTIMALFLGGRFEGHPPSPALMFPTYKECSVLINPMRAAFEAQGLDVIGVHCIKTGAPSVSPFPKARPDGLGKGGANG